MVDRLGFKKYLAQGGDWGAIITRAIAVLYPENLIGLHLNMNPSLFSADIRHTLHMLAGFIAPKFFFGDEFADFSFSAVFTPLIKETGYMHIQSTKPDTVGVSLNDSPLGLLAYILEKFSTWTNPNYITLKDGGLEQKFTKDELLTIISIYWFNQNILSSQRFYKECMCEPIAQKVGFQYVNVPTAFAAYPFDLIPRYPSQLMKYTCNLTQYTMLPEGGHFAAFEEPITLAADIFNFIQKLL